jgi:hypothetical protein
LLLGSFKNFSLSEEQKDKGKILLRKKQGDENYEEKELNKHLCFANRRCITEDKQR